MRDHTRVLQLTCAGLFLAIALVLPFLIGQIPQIGTALSPMHIPVLLCGFLCGWQWGMAVGFVAPLLRSVLFGMPAMFPGAVSMAFELAVYGIMAGILHRVLPENPWAVYVALVISMIGGRLVWGLVRYLLAGLDHTEFTLEMFAAGALTNALPGIILHIILIPPLVMALEKAGLTMNRRS